MTSETNEEKSITASEFVRLSQGEDFKTPAGRMRIVSRAERSGLLDSEAARKLMFGEPPLVVSADKTRESDEKCTECGQELADVTSSANAHLFFESLRVAARSPGYGDHHRAFVTSLLLRATEAGLYVPEEA